MRYKFVNQIFGVFKFIAAIVFVIAGVISLKNQDFLTTPNLGTKLGLLFGFLVLTVFCIYLIHSGWTQVKMTRIRIKTLFWIGFLIGLIILIVSVIYLIENGIFNLSGVHAVILTIIVFLINDLFRLKSKKVSD